MHRNIRPFLCNMTGKVWQKRLIFPCGKRKKPEFACKKY